MLKMSAIRKKKKKNHREEGCECERQEALAEGE